MNKVETAVLAFFNIAASQILSDAQKSRVQEKLPNRINVEGELWVKAQTHRTQGANRQEAIEKIHELIEKALLKKKLRIATKPSRQSKEKRIEQKKQASQKKEGRKKLRPGEW